ncbi:hypothetical protein [Clostridium mediterraneense]|uniref:hypothetical protein n=1 Tax=Clostridium mediterraneense TaxID=1805472 RepID=UPI00164D6041|nr:hypothetical protein [Clostridium mediterraneense]
MFNLKKLEDELVELKLKKRKLILAGQNSYTLDEEIKKLEEEINSKKSEDTNK